MSEVRSQGQCYTCSGASQSYFDASSTIMQVSPQTCSQILSHCASNFGLLLNFVTGLDYFLDILREALNPKRDQLLQKITELDKLADLIIQRSILSQVRKIAQFPKATNASFSQQKQLAQHRINICKRLVSISKPTFLQQILPMLNLKTEVFAEIDAILRTKLSAARNGKWQIATGRNLQESDPASVLNTEVVGDFVGDIDVVAQGLNLVGWGMDVYVGGSGISDDPDTETPVE